MEYQIKANSISGSTAEINIKESQFNFGITKVSENNLANPVELLLGSFSACVLKNVERFSGFMKFEYSKAEIIVNATRLDKPSRMDSISYELTIYSKDESINIDLLKKNIEKFGTIYNTLKICSTINGKITLIKEQSIS
jgi:uncharacterized OsmC-like protein